MNSPCTAPAEGNNCVDVDVAAILALHPHIVLGGVPEVYHASLCRKLAQRVFDADTSFCIRPTRVGPEEENRGGGEGGGGGGGSGGDSETQRGGQGVTAKRELRVNCSENVWLLKYTAEFSCADELQDLIRAEDDRAESSSAQDAKKSSLRPLRNAAGLASGATTMKVTNALLDCCACLLPPLASSSPSSADGTSLPPGHKKAPPTTKHGILEGLGVAFGNSLLGQTATCQLVTLFSSTCNAYVAVLWITTTLAAGDVCTVPRNNGCYMPYEQGGKAHLHRVASLGYYSLFHLLPETARVKNSITANPQLFPPAPAPAPAPTPAPPPEMVNLSPDSRRPVFLWKDFLKQDELSYFRNLIYAADPSAFGTQFVRVGEEQHEEVSKPEKDGAPPPMPMEAAASLNGGDGDGDGSLSPEVMAMVAAALAARGAGAGVTKNRLRTSHFLRTVWWSTSTGKEIYSRIARRAALRLGLCSGCAETPQMVCYPGGLSYFRPHHDSGRLIVPDDSSSSSSSSSSDSSSDESDDSDGVQQPWVRLDRDHFGAARVATVFVYLSTHDGPDDGAATTFSDLRDDTRSVLDNAHDDEPMHAVRVAPRAGWAAVWSNVTADGTPDPHMVHEGEPLNYPSMISMEAALKDRSLPLKIGLNLWFTDHPAYPHPEFGKDPTKLEYAAQDVQSAR